MTEPIVDKLDELLHARLNGMRHRNQPLFGGSELEQDFITACREADHLRRLCRKMVQVGDGELELTPEEVTKFVADLRRAGEGKNVV